MFGGFFSTWRNVLIALAIGLALGGLVGYLKGGEAQRVSHLKSSVNTLEELREADAESARLSRLADARLNKGISEVSARTAKYQKEVKNYVPDQRAEPADGSVVEAKASATLVHGSDLLLDGAVCVLDRARAGLPDDPAACAGNGKGGTPSTVTADDFIDNDLQVVGKYHELAKRHNELVDYVDGLIKRQNGAIKTESLNDH